MSNVITDFTQRVKISCDNDTMMYCFASNKVAYAYDRTMLHELWTTPTNEKVFSYRQEIDPETGETIVKEVVSNSDMGKPGTDGKYVPGLDEYTYYARVVLPRMVAEPCLNIFYKNANGDWVNYRKCMTVYPNLPLAVSSLKENVKVDINVIPKCVYIDKNRYVYYIDEHDGQDNELAISNIDIDTNDQNQVSYRPFRIHDVVNTDGTSVVLPSTATHMMNDLKVSLPSDKNIDNFLVWLNGAFVPTIKDTLYKNVFYIENAMTMVDTKVVDQILGAKATPTGSGATVRLDPSNDVYRYDVRLRFFGWDNVKVSPWYKPLFTEKVPIVHNFRSVYITKTVTFTEEINENAHFIMLNGVVLGSDSYKIDPVDKRKITLLNVENEAYALLNDVLADLRYDYENGTSYYTNVQPLNLIREALTERTYSLINFTSTEEGKTLYMKKSTACATNFPYNREVTFSKINSGDLILINGTFNRYEWIHENTIFFPKFTFTYSAEEANIKEKEIERIYFVSK